MEIIQHICKGQLGNPDHSCWCGRGENHTEAQHKADMKSDMKSRAEAELEQGLKESAAGDVHDLGDFAGYVANPNAAWEEWSVALTDITRDVPSYYEAFLAGWNARGEAR